MCVFCTTGTVFIFFQDLHSHRQSKKISKDTYKITRQNLLPAVCATTFLSRKISSTNRTTSQFSLTKTPKHKFSCYWLDNKRNTKYFTALLIFFELPGFYQSFYITWSRNLKLRTYSGRGLFPKHR